MARGRSSKAVQSQKCQLESCGNTVRQDNPTYPYCRHHQGMKTLSSRFNSPDAPMDMSVARETLYAPKATLLSRTRTTAEMISDSQGESSRTVVAAAYPAWKNASRGLDMSNPQVCYENRDRILSEVKTTMDSTGRVDTEIASCSGGTTMAANGEALPLDDHRVIIATERNSGDRFIVDVAAGAPLHNNPGSLDGYPSGGSTLSDGIVVQHVAEYAMFSSSDYSSISSESSGEPIWQQSVRVDDTSEVKSMRRAIEKYGSMRGNARIPIPSRTRTRKTTPPPQQQDLTLDELLSEDYQG